MDIVDLREFYASRLGLATRRSLAGRLKQRLAGLPGGTVMGLGYAMPYLTDCVVRPEAQLAFMMARQGVFRWPDEGAVQSALVDECDLPLLESVVDVALVVHGLELTDAPLEMLRELWRVLAPQGRLFLVVPNRRGVWARFDSHPDSQLGATWNISHRVKPGASGIWSVSFTQNTGRQVSLASDQRLPFVEE